MAENTPADENTDGAEQGSAQMGRPLKFESPVELQTQIDAYFADCDPHMEDVSEWVEARDKDGKLQKDEHGLNYLVEIHHKVMTKPKPYTITGLALALDTSRETLLEYEDRPDFVDTIKKAKLRCQQYVEGQLFTGNPAGPIFNLKNNYKWRDQTELKHSGSIDRATSEEELDAIINRGSGTTDQTGTSSQTR